MVSRNPEVQRGKRLIGFQRWVDGPDPAVQPTEPNPSTNPPFFLPLRVVRFPTPHPPTPSRESEGFYISLEIIIIIKKNTLPYSVALQRRFPEQIWTRAPYHHLTQDPLSPDQRVQLSPKLTRVPLPQVRLPLTPPLLLVDR